MEPKISKLEEGYEPPHIILEWGGREVTVYKMSLRSLEKATRVVEPHIKDIIAEMIGTATFVQAKGGQAVDLEKAKDEMEALVKERLSNLIVVAPGVILQLLAHIMDIPDNGPTHDFFWEEVSLEELLDSVEQLDELNNFGLVGNRLIQIMRALAQRYGIEIPNVTITEKQEATIEES